MMHKPPYNHVDQLLVPHAAFAAALARIEQCFRTMQDARDPVGIAIVGESRTGKSRALEHFEASYAPRRTEAGLVAPFVRVTVPPKPTVKSLASTLLYGLGDPRFDKGTEVDMNHRILKLLGSAQTVVLALDEFQHFEDKGTRRVQYHVADWLKVLVDRARVGLVVTGLPTSLAVIWQNEQLAGRFQAPVRMKRFDWRREDDRAEFVAILDALQEGLKPFETPDTVSGPMAFRFYCASGGLMGYLMKLLKQTTANALDAGTYSIGLSDLERAFEEAIGLPEGVSLNPFSRSFGMEANEALLAQVQQLGTRAPERPPPPRNKRPPKAGASEVLRARC